MCRRVVRSGTEGNKAGGTEMHQFVRPDSRYGQLPWKRIGYCIEERNQTHQVLGYSPNAAVTRVGHCHRGSLPSTLSMIMQ